MKTGKQKKKFKGFKANHYWFAASLLSYLACLFLPGFYLDGERDAGRGWQILLTGWLGAISSASLDYSWFANIFLGLSWVILLICWVPRVSKLRLIAASLAVIALIFAVPFFFMKHIEDMGGGESAVVKEISRLGMGYWMWLLSMFCALTATATTPNTKTKAL